MTGQSGEPLLGRSGALRNLVTTLLGLFVFSTVAAAQDLDAQGLADACTSCHGVNGRSAGSIPSIGGLDEAALLAQLRSFRDPQTAATIMNRIVRGYSDAELETLARYFSSKKPP
jgi:sulfide dehydrogenase cytochrome subunit